MRETKHAGRAFPRPQPEHNTSEGLDSSLSLKLPTSNPSQRNRPRSVVVKPKSANYLSYRVPIKSQQNPFPSTTPNPGYPVAFPILSLTRHCRLRINHICFAQAGSHCKPHIGNQCGSLHQLHYPASWQAAAGIYPFSRAH